MAVPFPALIFFSLARSIKAAADPPTMPGDIAEENSQRTMICNACVQLS